MNKYSRPQKKINFFCLFKIFRWQVIIHWSFTLLRTLLDYVLLSVVVNLFNSAGNNDFKENNNFVFFLPDFLSDKVFGGTHWKKEQFIIFGLGLAIVYFLTSHFEYLWKEKLEIKGEYYIKNLLSDKLRRLSFKERVELSKKTSTLAQIESTKIGKYWNNLYNRVFAGFFVIFVAVIDNWEDLRKLEWRTKFFSLFWIFLISAVFYLFLRKVSHSERKYKEELSKENSLTNEESNKIILIDSMGLTSQYERRQKEKFKKNQKLFISFTYNNSLSRNFSQKALLHSYPFLLLFLSGKEIGRSFFAFWEVFTSSIEITENLSNYGDYISSLVRVNNFLALPEKDDNPQGLKLEKVAIKWIEFKNVYFRYQEGKEWVLENCQAVFNDQEINKLSGDNGTGKTTILYLLLGILKPTKGQIIIHCQNGEIYDLKDINLQNWREKKVAYFSHDNLIEEGSTGQKQIKSINSNLTLKKEAQIIIFDEATNALDPASQEWIDERIERLLKENKIVIFTRHFK